MMMEGRHGGRRLEQSESSQPDPQAGGRSQEEFKMARGLLKVHPHHTALSCKATPPSPPPNSHQLRILKTCGEHVIPTTAESQSKASPIMNTSIV